MKEPQFFEAEIFMGTWGGVARFSSILAHLRTMSGVIFSGSYSFFLGVMYVVSDVWSQCCHHRSCILSDQTVRVEIRFNSAASINPSRGEVSDVVPLDLCAEVPPAIASAAFAYGAQLLNVQLCPMEFLNGNFHFKYTLED